jgi:hypothetical protein
MEMIWHIRKEIDTFIELNTSCACQGKGGYDNVSHNVFADT